MEFVISFDMRAPSFGANAMDLYAAALDQCAWADEIGFNAVGLGEHHASEDGYLPSPIPMAIGARPNTVVAVVIRIGRSRNWPARSSASAFVFP